MKCRPAVCATSLPLLPAQAKQVVQDENVKRIRTNVLSPRYHDRVDEVYKGLGKKVHSGTAKKEVGRSWVCRAAAMPLIVAAQQLTTRQHL